MFGSLFGSTKQPEADALFAKTFESMRSSGVYLVGNGSGPYIGMKPDGRNVMRDEKTCKWTIALGGLGYLLAVAYAGQPITETLKVNRSADVSFIQSQLAVAGVALYKVMVFEFFANTWGDQHQALVLARLLGQALLSTILSPVAYESGWLGVKLKFEALHEVLPSERPQLITANTRGLLKELGVTITPGAWVVLNAHFTAIYTSCQEILSSTVVNAAPKVTGTFSDRFDVAYKRDFQQLLLIAKSKL